MTYYERAQLSVAHHGLKHSVRAIEPYDCNRRFNLRRFNDRDEVAAHTDDYLKAFYCVTIELQKMISTTLMVLTEERLLSKSSSDNSPSLLFSTR